MAEAIERLKKFVAYTKLSDRQFYKETKLPESAFTAVKSTGTKTLEKIFLRYPELNMDWVITGRGEMLFAGRPLIVAGEDIEPAKISVGALEKHNTDLDSEHIEPHKKLVK